MDLWQALDGYCERVDPGYWAEPINAVTNAAFLIAAVVMYLRAPYPICRALAVVLGVIGVGSYLFHTHAQVWAAIADVTPIAIFVFLYVWAANRYFLALSHPKAAFATVAAVPFFALTGSLFARAPFFEISAAYWPVCLLIALYGVALWGRLAQVGRGLLIGAGLLAVSLTARSLDMVLCNRLPVGTHFVWHILNGVMLGWMIEVLRRHLAQAVAPR